MLIDVQLQVAMHYQSHVRTHSALHYQSNILAFQAARARMHYQSHVRTHSVAAFVHKCMCLSLSLHGRCHTGPAPSFRNIFCQKAHPVISAVFSEMARGDVQEGDKTYLSHIFQ